MPIKKAGKLRDGLLIAGALMMACLPYIWIPFFYIGMAASCSCLIVQFIFLRCPHCNKHLGRCEGDFCPFCGERLDVK